MKKALIPLSLLIVLALQGVAIEIATSFTSMQDVYIIAHWVLVFVICISLLFDSESSYYGIVYGVIFGLLIDIVYTDMLGTYMLGYGLTMFILQGVKHVFFTNIYTTMLMVAVGIMVADLFIHGIYAMVGIVDIPFWVYVWTRLLPTVLANLIFLIVLYPFVYRRFPRWRMEYTDGK
ncbi:MAG TPA: rod shape-determining protein MreD [Bacillota bacterium]|nr:rod shape-determining protein MreD [Bacillota bacterium]